MGNENINSAISINENSDSDYPSSYAHLNERLTAENRRLLKEARTEAKKRTLNSKATQYVDKFELENLTEVSLLSLRLWKFDRVENIHCLTTTYPIKKARLYMVLFFCSLSTYRRFK